MCEYLDGAQKDFVRVATQTNQQRKTKKDKPTKTNPHRQITRQRKMPTDKPPLANLCKQTSTGKHVVNIIDSVS
jgi:hypothetical protein